MKLTEDRKSIRAFAQTLAVASTITWNVLRKSNTRQTGKPSKTSAVDDRNSVRTVKKHPKSTVSDVTNNKE